VSARLAGETIEDGPASGNLNEMEDGQSEQNQDGVGEPRIKGRQVKALWHMVEVKELEDVEVKEVEAVTALADEEERAPGEECGDRMGAAEAKDERGEDWGHKTAVHE
jgi:hypothetical protein